jgi:UDP-N-acetylmuramate--alanine ligase
VEKRADLARAIAPKLREGDIVLTLGAGDITQVGPELLHLLSLETDSRSTERAVGKA